MGGGQQDFHDGLTLWVDNTIYMVLTCMHVDIILHDIDFQAINFIGVNPNRYQSWIFEIEAV